MSDAAKKYMIKLHQQRRLSMNCPNLKIFKIHKTNPTKLILKKVPSSINTSSESTIANNKSDNMFFPHAGRATKKRELPKLKACNTSSQLISNISLMGNSYSKMKCDVSIGCSDENDDCVEYSKKIVKSTISIPKRDIAFESNIFTNFLSKLNKKETHSVLRKSFRSNSNSPFPLLIKSRFQMNSPSIMNLKRLRYCRAKQLTLAACNKKKIIFNQQTLA